MKKIIAIGLILTLMFSLGACKKEKEPQEVEIYETEESIEAEPQSDAEPQADSQTESQSEEQTIKLNGTEWHLTAINDGSRENVQSAETYSFTEDIATLKLDSGEKFSGSYSLDDGKILLKVDGVDATFKFSVDGDEMTIIPEGSSTNYFYTKK